MASIRKSFNFRNGVQVDNDNFVVNGNGLVGIGTSVPGEVLDVQGNIQCSDTIISNNATIQNINITGVQTSSNLNISNFINVGVTSITSGIITSYTGVVTYYGDGGSLLNLPTSQWLDIDVGLGFTSIYAQGNVGIATDDPRWTFQIGGYYTDILNPTTSLTNGVGFNSTGDIKATGTITAGFFTGNGATITNIDASNISSGTLNLSRLPNDLTIVGSVTANDFVGIGSEITQIDAANIDRGTLSNDRLSTNLTPNTITVSTSATITSLRVDDFIGIGTASGTEDLRIFKTTLDPSSIRLTNSTSGPNDGILLRFGNVNAIYNASGTNALDLINYDSGNFNFYNNVDSVGTGNFNWLNDYSNYLMTLTDSGNLGIGTTNPATTFEIVGTSSVTSNSYVGGVLTVGNGINLNSGSFTASQVLSNKIGVATNSVSVSYDFQVGANPGIADGLGIKSGNVYLKNDIKQVRHINASGIITASSFNGNGASITNINASNISSGKLSNSRLSSTIDTIKGINFVGVITTTDIINRHINASGIITASSFSGNGASITNINASNISSGTLSEDRLPNTITKNINAGIVTANNNFVGIGSLITNINASSIDRGTLSENRLPSNITLTGSLTAPTIEATGTLIVEDLNVTSNVSIGKTITASDAVIGNSIQLSKILVGYGASFLEPVGVTTLQLFYNNSLSELEIHVNDPSVGIVSTTLALS